MNLFFGSVFRQPPLTSDIYISKNVQLLETFLVGNVEYRSSSVGNSTSSEFITDNYVLPTTFYNITIPLWTQNLPK